jgi:hypothetical protein
MTRALGHKLLGDYGVICTPSVTLRKMEQDAICLIVATDGVWEVRRGRGQGSCLDRRLGVGCWVPCSLSAGHE